MNRTIFHSTTMAVLAALGPLRLGAQINESATHQYIGNNQWIFQVTSRMDPALNNSALLGMSQIHLFLATGTPGPGFDCHLIAGPSARDGANNPRGVMYLADDVGDWGPNERDRYINAFNPIRKLMPAVEWIGGGGTSYGTDPAPPNDWPNNSQCMLIENGSKFTFYGADPNKVTVTFKVQFHLNNGARFWYGQVWKSVASLACNAAVPVSCYWSTFNGFGAVGVPDASESDGRQAVQALDTGLRSYVSRIDTGAQAGNRETFFLRFRHPNGVQEVGEIEVAITSSSSPPGSAASQCRVKVWAPNPYGYLYSDSGTLPPSGANLGDASAPSSTNSQCTFRPAGSKLQFLSPTDLLLRLDIEFGASWTGQRWIWRKASDLGRWGPGVPTDPPQTPAFTNPDNATFTATAPPAPSDGLDFQSFRACLQVGGADPTNPPDEKTCKLRPGVWPVGSPLVIERSRIRIQGAGKYATILQRDSSLLSHVFQTKSNPAVALNRIYIEDMTIDGNRPFGESTTPPYFSDVNLDSIDRPGAVPTSAAACEDNATSGYCGVRIRNVRFINARYGAISLQPPINFPSSRPANGATRGILIERSDFTRSLRAPIIIGLNGHFWPVIVPDAASAEEVKKFLPGQIDIGGTCDTAPPGTGTQIPPQNGSVPYLYNGLPPMTVTDVEIRNNFFELNDTGALGTDATHNIRVHHNAMLDNYNNGFDCGGGVIAVGHCAKNFQIDDNFIWNRNVYTWPNICATNPNFSHPNQQDKYTLAPALELWGTDIFVRNNHFEYLTTEGIAATGVERLTVSNNLIQNTSRGIHAISAAADEDDWPGIRIANCYSPNKPPPPVPPEPEPTDFRGAHRWIVDTAAISGNVIRNAGTIYQSYGVRLSRNGCGTDLDPDPAMKSISIQALPVGDNRQNGSCKYELMNLSSSSATDPCSSQLSLGDSVSGRPCGTSGCR